MPSIRSPPLGTDTIHLPPLELRGGFTTICISHDRNERLTGTDTMTSFVRHHYEPTPWRYPSVCILNRYDHDVINPFVTTWRAHQCCGCRPARTPQCRGLRSISSPRRSPDEKTKNVIAHRSSSSSSSSRQTDAEVQGRKKRTLNAISLSTAVSTFHRQNSCNLRGIRFAVLPPPKE